MRLFHFSEKSGITRFEPRPVLIPSARPPGREWLNGPLVWAIDEAHQPLYLFPRDCPRVLVWPTERTTVDDRRRWWSGGDRRMVAYVERAWLERVRAGRVVRYELPPACFEFLDDAGMWVSREPAPALGAVTIADLPDALRAQQVDLEVVDSLAPLRPLWSTTLHVSGIRLRNAVGWPSDAS